MNKINAVLSVLLMFIPFLSWADVNIGKISKTQWRKLESEHFYMVTDAKDIQAMRMLGELERFNYFVKLIMKVPDRPLEYKVPVIAVNSSRTFKSLGLPKSIGGLFVRNDKGERAIFAASKSFRSSSKGASLGRHIILHELTHLILDQAEFSISNPPWYREGIAEYFGTYREKDNQIMLGDTSILKDRFYSVFSRTGSYQSVNTEELFKFSALSIDTDASQRDQESFYARSFAVVHFMNADPDRKDAMMRYLRMRYNGATVDEAFERAFGVTYAQLDEYVNEYIKGKYMYARVFEKGMFGVKFPSFEISEPQLLSSLESVGYITEKLDYLSEDILGTGVKERMKNEVRELKESNAN